MLLGQLGAVFGGEIRERRSRRWLQTEVGGLRALIIERAGGFDLAVFLPGARDAQPPFSLLEDWELRGEHAVPRINEAFAFTGCRRGILLASSWTEPSLEDISAAFATLVAWSDKPWQPRIARHELDPQLERFALNRLIRITFVLAVIALVRWWRRR